MKTIKSILIAATLVSATLVSGLSAQEEAQPAQKHEFHLAIGDSVMIKRECQKYLTGERPSTWVWDKVHTVRQLGTIRNPNQFPDGVLLMNIYSWMCEDCLINVNGRAEEASAKAAEEQAEEREAWEQAQQAGEDAEAAAAKAAAEKAAREAAELEAQEAAAREEAARLAALAEEEAAKAAAEQAKQDSIKSEQKFKHNYNRFTIGLRGGAASLLHKVDNGNWNCGGDVVLDLQYAHYWAKDGRPVDLGIITGIGIGYAQSSLKANPNADTTIIDSDGMTVDYTIRADEVKEHDGQLQLEIPLMFSLIHDKGLFFNIGPKFMIPVYTPYKQTLSRNANTQVSAYLQDVGVTFVNDDIMGKFSEGNYVQNGNDYKNQFTINVMLTAEIGYEWTLKSGNSFALGAFANYSVYNSFKNDPTNKSLVELLTKPSNTENATFNVNPATQTYANGLGFFDAGIKLAYHFNFPKKLKHFAADTLY